MKSTVATTPKSRWAEGGTPTPNTNTKNRWDDGGATPTPGTHTNTKSRWDDGAATPTPGTHTKSRWDDGGATPTPGTQTKSRWDDGGATPTPGTHTKSRWDDGNKGGATPTPASAKRSRWDEDQTPGSAKRSRWDTSDVTPTPGAGMTPTTPSAAGKTPAGSTPGQQATPVYATPADQTAFAKLATPTPTPEQYQVLKWTKEIDERNKPITDKELDDLLPSDGYKVLDAPADYQPNKTPIRLYRTTPTPFDQGFSIPEPEPDQDSRVDIPKTLGPNLPDLRPEDYQHFQSLLEQKDEADMSPEELRDNTILKLLLKIKNGTPPQRKQALRKITDKAREFGAGPLFDHILPILMSPTLEDQERHLIVKVIDRVLYKLDDLVRPYVHKILVVIEPMLIDEDYYARVEGREIVSNLAKAAGLATMIATMRPDIDNSDEYVRNVTARAFAVVASALGIPSLQPFLKAVCQSKKSWQARHTGIKIVQQMAILMGCAVLPHLRALVETVGHGLKDEQPKVRTITALALASLAEACHPYGIESFESVLKELWQGVLTHRGKGLAAFLKAIGYIIPLMDADYAKFYTGELMETLLREFKSPDDEMKKIVLKVVKQCVGTDGIDKEFIDRDITPHFFKHFWTKRMAPDKRNYKAVVETTVEIAKKVGGAEIMSKIVEDLKDDSEPYRRMVMETVELIVRNQGVDDIDQRLEELLIDGMLYAFQEQTTDDSVVMLTGFGTVVNTLGKRASPYLQQIFALATKWGLSNKTPKVRQMAADLIAKIAASAKLCNQENLLTSLGQVLYDYLGEEYPEVLGSVLGALKAIVNCVGMQNMKPKISDLLPKLTPVLKNRHEKVQENCIDLVGRIADRGHSYVNAREWMRICFELLDLLKAHRKAIRRAAVNTFGYIAKAIGPTDVMVTLLNNLKVQERQLRVCTTVAIAIVAEICGVYAILPSLMNEYRVPELNVQTGVLKALSFMFECVGEVGKDYVYAVVPLLEDALMERDHVHRQIACNVVKHMSLGAAGFDCEDAFRHVLNYVWPNVFETSPHVINAVFEALEGLRTALGPTILLQYILQGLFHPARKVRDVYWKIYNNVYIGHQDALIPSYPRLESDNRNRYARDELDYFL